MLGFAFLQLPLHSFYPILKLVRIYFGFNFSLTLQERFHPNTGRILASREEMGLKREIVSAEIYNIHSSEMV